jgi:transglutaminase-like putative cysteine protease
MRVAGDGHPLAARWGAFALRLEEAQRARSAVEGFDALSDGVPLEGTLPETSRLDSVELRVKGSRSPPPSRANQRVGKDASGFVVRLERGPSGPVLDAERAEAMRETNRVDYRTPALRDRALSLVMGKTAVRDKLEALLHYTHQHLEKQLSTHLHAASEVLEAGRGDCTEHSLLLIAMARASGIPAREVSGLVYGGRQSGQFAYHSWVEVEIDGAWHPVDPSWNELSANPSHLALSFGADSSWLSTVGQMELEVIGFTEKKL